MPSRSLLMAVLAGAAIHQIRAACTDSYNYNFTQVTANQCSSAPYGPYCWRNTCAACGDTQQSPINIAQHYVRTVAKQLPLEFEGNDIHNGCTRAKFFNNGHALEASFENLCNLATKFNGTVYELQSMQVHTPSEHQIGGATFEGEVQLVHSNANKNQKLILSVLLRAAPSSAGKWNYTDNSFMGNFLGSGFDQGSGHKFTGGDDRYNGNTEEEAKITDLGSTGTPALHPYGELVPPNPSYFAYQGSLTAPPCTQNVQWVVLAQPVAVGGLQMAQVRKYLFSSAVPREPNQGMPSGEYRNNRPTQDPGTRTVAYYNGAPESVEESVEEIEAAEHAEEEDHTQWYTPILQPVGGVFSFVGVIVMIVGAFVAALNMALLFVQNITGRHFPKAILDNNKPSLAVVRTQFAKSTIICLEILVAADVIDTLAKPVEAQTFSQLGLISIIVAVRTVLSLHLGHELHDIKHSQHDKRHGHGESTGLLTGAHSSSSGGDGGGGGGGTSAPSYSNPGVAATGHVEVEMRSAGDANHS